MMSDDSPVHVRIWNEGSLALVGTALAVETDGETITVINENGESEYAEDEWDELTVA